MTRAVDRALADHGGDIKAATEALVKKAVPNAMALFEETRVGAQLRPHPSTRKSSDC